VCGRGSNWAQTRLDILIQNSFIHIQSPRISHKILNSVHISIILPEIKIPLFFLICFPSKGLLQVYKIFQYISNKMQRYTVYFIWKLLYMFRVVPSPIIRSAYNCTYSTWYLSHRHCYLPLWRIENENKHIWKRIVPQVGYLQRLYLDARSTEF
jgi:hypothetical protein